MATSPPAHSRASSSWLCGSRSITTLTHDRFYHLTLLIIDLNVLSVLLLHPTRVPTELTHGLLPHLIESRSTLLIPHHLRRSYRHRIPHHLDTTFTDRIMVLTYGRLHVHRVLLLTPTYMSIASYWLLSPTSSLIIESASSLTRISHWM